MSKPHLTTTVFTAKNIHLYTVTPWAPPRAIVNYIDGVNYGIGQPLRQSLRRACWVF